MTGSGTHGRRRHGAYLVVASIAAGASVARCSPRDRQAECVAPAIASGDPQAAPAPDRLGACEQSCRDGVASACEILGDLLLASHGDGGPQAGAADQAYRQACDGSSASACRKLAELRKTIQGGVDEALLERACSGGDAVACTSAGILREGDAGNEHDFSKALPLYRRSCDAGEPEGCHRIAVHLLAGAQRITFELTAAEERAERNELPADALEQRRRELEPQIEKAKREAMALNERACERGPAAACYAAASKDNKPEAFSSDAARTARLLAKACAADHAQACVASAAAYESGSGIAMDLGKAAAQLRRACDLGAAKGCERLAEMIVADRGVARDQKAAAELYGRACDLALLPACHEMGRRLLAGEGVDADAPKAAALYTRACDGGVLEACRGLAALYAGGEGVPSDPERAATLYEKAGCRRVDKGWLCGAHRAKPPQVRMGSVSVSGRLGHYVLRRTIEQNMHGLRECYERGLSGDPQLRGEVVIRFVIGRDGRVPRAAREKSELPADVVDCMLHAVRGFRFPSPEGGIVTVTFPFRFEPDP